MRKLTALLNDQTGFILRKEDPDLGCDYMVELVAGSGAAASKFPLQLKSIETDNARSRGEIYLLPG